MVIEIWSDVVCPWCYIGKVRFDRAIEALTSGPDGLDDLRAIVSQAGQHLLPDGWLLLEHGHDQGAAVRDLLSAAGFRQVSTRTDLAGMERCSAGQWPGLG